MMGRAYAYCEGNAPPPKEHQLYSAIRDYGAVNVLGRALRVREIRNMNLVENIITCYKARAAAEIDFEWETTHPEETKMLTAAFMEYQKQWPKA